MPASAGERPLAVVRHGPRLLDRVRAAMKAVLERMEGVTALMGTLLYGSGLRVLECAELRVKDLNFDRRELTVRDGKGRKDRVTMLPGRLVEPLQAHLTTVRALHEADLAAGHGSVSLPDALDRKYPPFDM